MLYRHNLRFQGYWLGLIAWIMLSLVMPAANALSDSDNDNGWLRLCSVTGAQWYNASPTHTSAEPQAQSCLCLSQLLVMPAMAIEPPGAVQSINTAVEQANFIVTAQFLAPLPRAPPF